MFVVIPRRLPCTFAVSAWPVRSGACSPTARQSASSQRWADRSDRGYSPPRGTPAAGHTGRDAVADAQQPAVLRCRIVAVPDWGHLARPNAWEHIRMDLAVYLAYAPWIRLDEQLQLAQLADQARLPQRLGGRDLGAGRDRSSRVAGIHDRPYPPGIRDHADPGAPADRRGIGDFDDRPVVRRPGHTRVGAVRATGIGGVVRRSVRVPLGPDPRVRRHRAYGTGPRDLSNTRASTGSCRCAMPALDSASR